jgi:hypothetical protein
MECTKRMWPTHKASCKAWRAELEAEGGVDAVCWSITVAYGLYD